MLSNDDRGELNTLLLHARWRIAAAPLLPTLAPHYDLLLIDTGARAACCWRWRCWPRTALSPVTPEILAARAAARHAHRGHRAVPPPRHRAAAAAPAHQPRASGVVECAADPAGAASGIREQLACACWTPTCRRLKPIRARARTAGASGGIPPAGGPHGTCRVETMRALAGELFPAWQERFALVTGRGDAGGAGHGQRT